MSKLAFDAASHRYTVDGAVWPSVTQVIAPLYDFSGIPPGVLAAKAQLGTAVHLAAELHDADDLDEASVGDDVRPYLEGYRRFLAERSPSVLAAERRIGHGLHRFAGTVDRLMFMDCEYWAIDLKTTVDIHPAVGVQLAAYAELLKLEGGWGGPGAMSKMRRAALQLKPDGTYRLHEFTNPNDWAVFMACLTVHRFKEQHK